MKRASFQRLIHAVFAVPTLVSVAIIYVCAIAPYQASVTQWTEARDQWELEMETVPKVKEVREKLQIELATLRSELEATGAIDVSKLFTVSQLMAVVGHACQQNQLAIQEFIPIDEQANQRLTVIQLKVTGSYQGWYRLLSSLETHIDQAIVRRMLVEKMANGELQAELHFLAIRDPMASRPETSP